MAINKKFVDLHVHTDASLSDGAQSVNECLDRQKELGAEACAITDHGGCWNWLDFFNYGNKIGVKPILGTEAYIKSVYPVADEEITKYSHFCVLAKDYIGFQGSSRFVSETNRNLNPRGKATGTIELLDKFFGPDSEAYGHVVAMTACIGGIIANEFSVNYFIDKEINKINNRIEASKKTLPDDFMKAYNTDCENLAKIAEIDAEIKSLEPFTKKTIKMTEKQISKIKNETEREMLLFNLLNEKEKIAESKAKIAELKVQKKAIQDINRPFHQLVSKQKNKLGTITENEERIAKLEAAKKTDEEMFSNAVATMEKLKEIFGENLYAEIQYHGIEKEAEIYPKIVEVARYCNVPLVATNDVHIARKEDAKKRELLSNVEMVSQNRSWRPMSTGDDELYIKTTDELIEIFSEVFDGTVINEAIENTFVISDMCNLELSKEKHYPKFENSKELLRQMALDGIPKKYPNGFPKEYRQRMEYELEIIDKMGFNDYFCEVADFIQFAKKSGDNSVEIGPGRGSGAGSIVCYLTDITEIEPMSNNLLFERFLNPERVSMPDIDTDFSAHARKISLTYVKEKYGERAVANIMTKGKIAAKKALEYSHKLLGLETLDDKKAYTMQYKAIRKLVGDEPNAKLKNYADIIRQTCNDEISHKILDYALMIEGYIINYGTHAAGVIISDGTDVENYIPLMASEDDDGNPVFAVQADMVQCEAQLGFIKMDFLGLKNLNIITDAQRLITQRHGVVIEPYKLPFEPEIFREIFAKGDTNFVFQFESEGMKGMLKELQPTCFGDIVLAVSVYRPGPMEFIPDIIHCKKTGEKSEFVKRVPLLEPILEETYGYPVYQEQVMKIMTDCAGFTMGQADNVRRHMSKKHEEEIAAIRPDFVKGCAETNAIDADTANWIFDQLMPFAKYGFNKSHAAAYSTVSYITAWLKYHYRVEYLAAAMNTQTEKTAQFVEDCKASNIKIYRPDINLSGDGFLPYEDGIVIGFKAIKGTVKEGAEIVAAREAHGTFDSIEDALENINISAAAFEKLVLAGAFDSFTRNREITANEVKGYKEIMKTRKTLEEKLAKAQEVLVGSDDAKTIKDNQKKVTECNTKLPLIKKQLETTISKEMMELSTSKRLGLEAEFLGMWVTGNPLSEYNLKGYIQADMLEEKMGEVVKFAGVITQVKVIQTKKGDQMAFVTAIDKTGSQTSIVVFPNDYKSYGSILDENVVVEIKGKVDYDNSDNCQIVASEIKSLQPKDKVLFTSVKTIEELIEVMEIVRQFKTEESGMPVNIHVEDLQEVQTTAFKVSSDCAENLNKRFSCRYASLSV